MGTSRQKNMRRVTVLLALLGAALAHKPEEEVNIPTSDYSQCDAGGNKGSFKIVVKDPDSGRVITPGGLKWRRVDMNSVWTVENLFCVAAGTHKVEFFMPKNVGIGPLGKRPAGGIYTTDVEVTKGQTSIVYLTSRTVGDNANEQASGDKSMANSSDVETQQKPSTNSSNDPSADERSSCGEMMCNYCDDSGCCDSDPEGRGCKKTANERGLNVSACPKPGVPCNNRQDHHHDEHEENGPCSVPGTPGCITLVAWTTAQCSGEGSKMHLRQKVPTGSHTQAKCAKGNKLSCSQNMLSLSLGCAKGNCSSNCKNNIIDFPLDGSGPCTKIDIGGGQFVFGKFEGSCEGENYTSNVSSTKRGNDTLVEDPSSTKYQNIKQTECFGHYGRGGDGHQKIDPDGRWCCLNCNCRDKSDAIACTTGNGKGNTQVQPSDPPDSDTRDSCGEHKCNYCDNSGCCTSDITGDYCKKANPQATPCPERGVSCNRAQSAGPPCPGAAFKCQRDMEMCVKQQTEESCNASKADNCKWSQITNSCLKAPLSKCLARTKTGGAADCAADGSCVWVEMHPQSLCVSTQVVQCSFATNPTDCMATPGCRGAWDVQSCDNENRAHQQGRNGTSHNESDLRDMCGEYRCNYCDDSGCCTSDVSGQYCKNANKAANPCPVKGQSCRAPAPVWHEKQCPNGADPLSSACARIEESTCGAPDVRFNKANCALNPKCGWLQQGHEGACTNAQIAKCYEEGGSEASCNAKGGCKHMSLPHGRKVCVSEEYFKCQASNSPDTCDTSICKSLVLCPSTTSNLTSAF